ncbi:transglutaminase domain-containing protein [Gorillibacterium massiliense]|uniref:transglutaminase domain-containing protein n=1 Tax=Gorillibacterium massiliense TaxID=1280390 RepID=UPI0004B359E2|nr:transglutaminase domain-containing protein [Gorillibacterium massiliense]
MKKLSALLIVFVMLTTLVSSPISLAASYFSNNSALNSMFQQLEKVFLQYKKDELVPLKDYGIIIGSEEDKKDMIPRTKKPISAQQMKAAAQKKLNDIKVAVEIKEEELGGLTQQDYKTISDHFNKELMIAAKYSNFGWDTEGKEVHLYLDINSFDDEDMCDFKDLVGKFATMGKAKDEVNQADLQVKDNIIRYLNQSIQRGNTISPEILENLPTAVENLFVEHQLSKIEAARALALIHKEIYPPEGQSYQYDKYDGSKSLAEFIDDYDYQIEGIQEDREKEKQLEYYVFPADEPSPRAKQKITEDIIDGSLPESFAYGFNKPITLGELAKLYFGSGDNDNDKEVLEKTVIDDPAFDADSPDYIKLAYIFGMIDDTTNLDKPMTRVEAARKFAKGIIYDDYWDDLQVTDAAKIPIADQVSVATCIKHGMKTRIDKFEPQSSYTREEAILDHNSLDVFFIRGYKFSSRITDASKVIVGKNTLQLLFDSTSDMKTFIEDNYGDTVIGNIKPTGNYTKIDTGGALIEFFTPQNGIKFTVKNGTTNFDLEEGVYGPGVPYKIEPKVVKSTDKVDMNMQIDSTFKKLNAKLDAILAKIIKPNMTQEQKVKAIHDYVVLHVTYDIKYLDEQSLESVFVTIDKGRGVCGDYSLLFMHLCRRAGIPCIYEAGYLDIPHAWNSVYVNNQWLFVDTTWDDDDSGKIKYTYFLKDRFTFMRDHTPLMGSPDKDVFVDIDPMNIKSQDELRGYLLQNFIWTDGYQLTFRMADKNIKPVIGYMHDYYVTVSLKYDAKNNLYTVIAKDK